MCIHRAESQVSVALILTIGNNGIHFPYHLILLFSQTSNMGFLPLLILLNLGILGKSDSCALSLVSHVHLDCEELVELYKCSELLLLLLMLVKLKLFDNDGDTF
jgi:hypothetical protein